VRVPGQDAVRSPAWRGRLTATAPPTISGDATLGGSVVPVVGSWSGGWGDERSWLSLAACATPQGTGCVALPAASACRACAENPKDDEVAASHDGPAALPPIAVGRFLFATETRVSPYRPGWSNPATAATPPWSSQRSSDLPPASTDRSLSVPVLVPTPAPLVSLRRNAQRVKGQVRLGSIACRLTCKVSMKVSGGRVKASTTYFTVTGSRLLTTPPGRHGQLTVRIHVDGKLLLANGKVTAR
jgi:hypothetical protein